MDKKLSDKIKMIITVAPFWPSYCVSNILPNVGCAQCTNSAPMPNIPQMHHPLKTLPPTIIIYLTKTILLFLLSVNKQVKLCKYYCSLFVLEGEWPTSDCRDRASVCSWVLKCPWTWPDTEPHRGLVSTPPLYPNLIKAKKKLIFDFESAFILARR